MFALIMGGGEAVVQLPSQKILGQRPRHIDGSAKIAVAPHSQGYFLHRRRKRALGYYVYDAGENADAVEQRIGSPHHLHSLHIERIYDAPQNGAVLGDETAVTEAVTVLKGNVEPSDDGHIGEPAPRAAAGGWRTVRAVHHVRARGIGPVDAHPVRGGELVQENTR